MVHSVRYLRWLLRRAAKMSPAKAARTPMLTKVRKVRRSVLTPDSFAAFALLSEPLQSTIQQFQPVLTPKYLAGGKNVTRCTEDACR
jgi:hypothetical protein